MCLIKYFFEVWKINKVLKIKNKNKKIKEAKNFNRIMQVEDQE